MANYHTSPLLLLLLLVSTATTCTSSQTFQQCLHSNSLNNTNFLLYTPTAPPYKPILQQTLQNLRFSSSSPSFLLLPTHPSHVRAAVLCCRLHRLRLTVRSGGHDYEGLSYRSPPHFLLLDLSNMTSIRFPDSSHAWVGSGATLGQLYYAISKRSPTLAFPAGLCPQVGVGGLLGGGGIGTLMRKHGLSADNAVDAVLVDAEGRVLDRSSMGEDLFWAIRGGGAASFGVVLSWKLRLVAVPTTVTTFAIYRTLEEGAISLLHKWQTIGPNLPEDLFLRVLLRRRKRKSGGELAAKFHAMYLGSCRELVRVMARSFPDLAMGTKDCNEMSWVRSAMYFAGHRPGKPLEELLERGWLTRKSYFKGKSDFVQEPISEEGLTELWRKAAEEDRSGMVILDPMGGRVGAMPEEELPFPHRKGLLYNVQYLVGWKREEEGGSHLRWVEAVHRLMGRWVSKRPRRAYFNYRDTDIGTGGEGYFGENGWGRSYFVGNAERLAEVKARVDPMDFFRSEQSVPPGRKAKARCRRWCRCSLLADVGVVCPYVK